MFTVPVRTASEQPYRLQDFELRIFYASDIAQPSPEVRNLDLISFVIAKCKVLHEVLLFDLEAFAEGKLYSFYSETADLVTWMPINLPVNKFSCIAVFSLMCPVHSQARSCLICMTSMKFGQSTVNLGSGN